MDPTTIQWLLNFGALGLVFVLMVSGMLVPGWVYRNLKDANDKLQDALTLERERNQGLQQVATTGAQAMQALTQLAEEHRASRAGDAYGDLTKDRQRAVVPEEGAAS